MKWVLFTIGFFVLLVIVWFISKFKKAARDLQLIQQRNLANKEPLILDDELSDAVKRLKATITGNEVLAKHRLGTQIMKFSSDEWRTMQTRLDAHLWDRLDNRI